jgi:hypothetical protein
MERHCKHTFLTIERPCFLRCPCKGVIKKSAVEKKRVQLRGASPSEYEIVVKNWVKFWKWQSKTIEKKWQEMN